VWASASLLRLLKKSGEIWRNPEFHDERMQLLMLGVFLGNWLIVPYFTRTRDRRLNLLGPSREDHTKGFFIGLIAAFLVFVFYWLFGWESYEAIFIDDTRRTTSGLVTIPIFR